LINCKSK